MLKLLKKLSAKDWLLVVLAVAFVVLMVWCEMTMPDYMSEITKLVTTDGSQMKDVWIAGGCMLAYALGSLICAVAVSIIASRVASNFSATLRRSLFSKVQGFSMQEIGKFSTASLITRSTNDVTQVQMLITLGLSVMVKAPITAVWAICKIASGSWQWTLATGIAVILLLLVVLICTALALPRFKKMQELTDDVNRVTRENLTGIRVVRAYNAEEYQEGKFKKANDKLTNTALFTGRTMSFLMPSIQLILSGLSLAIFWIGAFVINKANMLDRIGLFADMVIFLQYGVQVLMAFMMLVMIFILMPRAQVAAKRINEVLATETVLKDGEAQEGIEGHTGEVEFKDVSFYYPDGDANAIEGITFKASKGETVALIGATGSGKSTVINLIPRFYDVSGGEVFVDGKNVKEYKQTALRNKIGYISQKATLFSGTIDSNVAFGESFYNIVKEDIEHAITIAQASDFVSDKGGIQYAVAQGGANLSGGQKQRISIARAVARKPEILIFDDSFSALDYKTDKTLRQALERECKDSTKIIVAQRIGTIRDADRIIVLDDGKVVGQGKHKELMQNCETYRQIAYSQLSPKELEDDMNNSNLPKEDGNNA
ncbi:MAG: ABC transporter ATP-binding protein/permease [Clostridia bacterium]|nr:ABC transporter ATP-binding protein/permease [Clostridia bacterium]